MGPFFSWLASKLTPKAEDRCESAWEEEPYLSEEVRAALHPFDAEAPHPIMRIDAK